VREYCVTNCIDICYTNGNLNVATVPVVKYHPFCPAGTDATDWHKDAMANTHLEGRMEVGSKEWHWFILPVQRLSCLLAISQVLSHRYVSTLTCTQWQTVHMDRNLYRASDRHSIRHKVSSVVKVNLRLGLKSSIWENLEIGRFMTVATTHVLCRESGSHNADIAQSVKGHWGYRSSKHTKACCLNWGPHFE
jgi:hypothetical protein